MAIRHLIVLFVETPKYNKSHIISTDEDPGLRIESFAVINLRGVSTNKTIVIIQLINTHNLSRCPDVIYVQTCNFCCDFRSDFLLL
jgi:hypothetical protein